MPVVDIIVVICCCIFIVVGVSYEIITYTHRLCVGDQFRHVNGIVLEITKIKAGSINYILINPLQGCLLNFAGHPLKINIVRLLYLIKMQKFNKVRRNKWY